MAAKFQLMRLLFVYSLLPLVYSSADYTLSFFSFTHLQITLSLSPSLSLSFSLSLSLSLSFFPSLSLSSPLPPSSLSSFLILLYAVYWYRLILLPLVSSSYVLVNDTINKMMLFTKH